MDIHSLLIFQIIADIVLCAAILFLLRVINKSVRQRQFTPDDKSLNEFRRLLDESQIFGTHFLQALEDSREILREIASAIEDREKVLGGLMAETDMKIEAMKKKGEQREINPSASGNKYADAISMAKQGLNYQEISRRSGLTEGEVELIVDLEHRKESRA